MFWPLSSQNFCSVAPNWRKSIQLSTQWNKFEFNSSKSDWSTPIFNWNTVNDTETSCSNHKWNDLRVWQVYQLPGNRRRRCAQHVFSKEIVLMFLRVSLFFFYYAYLTLPNMWKSSRNLFFFLQSKLSNHDPNLETIDLSRELPSWNFKSIFTDHKNLLINHVIISILKHIV